MSTVPLEGDPGLLVTRCASEIELERVEWLWHGRLALGKHTSVGGDPGGGKSNLATYTAAMISTGREWPCGEGRALQGSVLILSAEDGAADTIVPRLYAAEADCGRVHIVSAVRVSYNSSRGFNLQADLELLEEKIRELGDVALVIIDPVSSYLGKTDSHKNAEVRAVLEPLSAMAERARVAVLSITHFSKAGAATGSKAIHRFIGSIAFVGAPRMAFAVIEDPDDKDRRLLLHAKNNLAVPPQGLAYRLEQTTVGEGIVASRVKWESEPVSMTANEALAAESDSSSDKGAPREEAKDFLQQSLAAGPADVATVNAQAKVLGITERTLKRARHDLGVKATKGDFEGGWQLSMPEGGHQQPKGAT
jgi:putative DNA primase/helicase